MIAIKSISNSEVRRVKNIFCRIAASHSVNNSFKVETKDRTLLFAIAGSVTRNALFVTDGGAQFPKIPP